MANFPTSLDTFVDEEDGVSYPVASDMNGVYDAIEKIEATIGTTDSAVATSHDYRIAAIETFGSEVTSADKYVGKTATQTLSSKTLTKPTINGSILGTAAYTPDAAGTATLDCAAATRHVITMPAGNITIALSNISTNQVIEIEIIQDGVGSRTVTWFTTIKWPGGTAPVLTTTASKKDVFMIVCTGAGTYDGHIASKKI